MTNDPTLPPGIDIEYWFSAHETARLAADVEENGVAFYRRLAGEVPSDKVRDMCVLFAGQEAEHKEAFRAIARHFSGETVEYAYSVDIRAMLRASLGEIVALFSNHAERLLDGGGVSGCLGLARRIEETSVAVYGHMRQTYSPRFSSVLTRILAEEEKHLQVVLNVLASLSDGVIGYPGNRT